MNNSQQISELMCRACMCKNQTLHSLCDESSEKSLTICEMFAKTIPQVAIHSNDELPKKICASCLNKLLFLHKFQQMCITSDAYMRSLVASNRLTIHGNIAEQLGENKCIINEEVTEKLDIRLVTQDPHKFPRSIKIETSDKAVNETVLLEPTKCCQMIGATDPEWSDDDDIRPLKRAGNVELTPIVKEELQDCIKFEVSDIEVRECDLMTSLKSETDLLENDDGTAKGLDYFTDSGTNSEWNEGDKSRRQKKLTYIPEQQQPSTLSVTNETDIYKIEKPNSSSHLQYNFPCPHCEAVFSGDSSLKRHSHLHDQTRPFVCEVCNYRFETSTNLLHHRNTHKMTPPGGFKCQKCPRRFEKQKSLSSHMRTHRENTFKCDLCPQKFRKQTRLEDHLRQHESQKLVLENGNDNSKKDLERSIDDDKNINSDWNNVDNSRYQKKSAYNTSKAEQQQTSTSDVTNEANVYKIEKPNLSSKRKHKFPCPHCDATFSANSILKRHSLLHDITRPFVCEVCNYRFETHKSFAHHKKTHKETPPGGFKCPKCPRRFEKQISLSSHMSKHRENNFKCNLCPKKFGKLTRLTDHLRQHEGQKCMLDNKKDITITDLERGIDDVNETNSEWTDVDNSGNKKKSTSNVSQVEHQPSIPVVTSETDLYEIEKPNSSSHLQYNFACSHCDATFSSESNLKRHSYQHDETRPFVCDICNYRFETSTNLLHHKNTHKITPPDGFKCSKCPRRFEKQISLSSHMNAHREKILKCDVCPQKFGTLKRRQQESQLSGRGNKINNTDTILEQSTGNENEINSDDDNRKYQKKSTTNVNKAEPQQSGTFIVTNETDVYKIEKPRSSSLGQFPCPHCDATFCANSNLKKHSHLHDETRLFACEVCNYRFKTKGKLLHHKNRHKMTPPGGFKCPKCPRRFERNKSLSSHLRKHPERYFKCNLCLQKFEKLAGLTDHLRQHEIQKCMLENENDNMDANLEPSIGDDNYWQVKQMSKVTKEGQTDQDSITSKVNDTNAYVIEKPNSRYKLNFRCEQCDAAFTSSNKLRLHARVHLATNLFLCEICNYRYKTSSLLAQHITNKHNNKPEPVEGYKCLVCSRRFEKIRSMKLHLASHKKTVTKQVCKHCKKEFENQYRLKEHIRIHTGERPYLCSQCSKSFRTIAGFKDHRRRHAGIKSHQCPECPRKFVSISDKMKHIKKMHRGIKSHSCEICNSRFWQISNLKRHRLIHTEERPHKCDKCNKKFAYIDYLRLHQRTHNSDKPYKCKHCENSYCRKSNLIRHIRTHVGDKIYICEQCPEKFQYQKELFDHQPMHYEAMNVTKSTEVGQTI